MVFCSLLQARFSDWLLKLMETNVHYFCNMSTDALTQICSNYIQIDKPKTVGFALLDPLYPIPRPRLSTSNWDTVNMILNLDKLFCDNVYKTLRFVQMSSATQHLCCCHTQRRLGVGVSI